MSDYSEYYKISENTIGLYLYSDFVNDLGLL
ncbi:Uncharacterised protein [Pseudomonas luteola]|uniref:Uncharacterized protein n=1 Tax=Pseudomonas luteola TaxID=47886 RepID=A0A2X2BUU9_PSELU|nr:hypothetical protein SAMN05216295_113146 [Pseudomonas zeshuii]SPZ00162.1 Uncharacterised protein [Pseudomonas luteola]